MYIVKEDLPENCFRCKYNVKCDVWQLIMSDMFEPQFMDYPTPKPKQFKCCKLIVLPTWIDKWYKKWVLKQCRHICLWCRHRKECDL